MVDPYTWALTPGQGRAPLLAAPQATPGAVESPQEQLARLLMQQTGSGYGQMEDNRVMERDRPVGSLVRDPATMTIDEKVMEARALEGPQRFAPNIAAALAAGGTPVVSTVAGLAGRQGIQNRIRNELDPSIARDLGGIFATGGSTPQSMRPSRDTRPATIARTPATEQMAFFDAYEAGRAAARGSYTPEREQRGGGDSRSRGGGGGGQTRDSYAI